MKFIRYCEQWGVWWSGERETSAAIKTSTADRLLNCILEIADRIVVGFGLGCDR